jgi:hypothetical protein
MTRRSLATALGAATTAAAQIVITPGETRIGAPYLPNGVCPTCFERHPPIKAEPCYAHQEPRGPVPVLCPPKLMRCRKCSAAFWMDVGVE